VLVWGERQNVYSEYKGVNKYTPMIECVCVCTNVYEREIECELVRERGGEKKRE